MTSSEPLGQPVDETGPADTTTPASLAGLSGPDPEGPPLSTASDAPDDAGGLLWAGDAGALPYEARRALLHLIRGPYLAAGRNRDLYQALLNNRRPIESRLADIFMELVVDQDAELAFVRNAQGADGRLPRAVRNMPLTTIDTLMVLTLRWELLMDSLNRVFIGRDEMLEQLANYRPISKLDEAGFHRRLMGSWSKLVKAGILRPVDGNEDRCEISPVLRLVFGTEEVRAIAQEFADLLALANAGDAGDGEGLDGADGLDGPDGLGGAYGLDGPDGFDGADGLDDQVGLDDEGVDT